MIIRITGGELLRGRYVLRWRARYDVPNLKSARTALPVLKVSDFVTFLSFRSSYNKYLKCEILEDPFFPFLIKKREWRVVFNTPLFGPVSRFVRATVLMISKSLSFNPEPLTCIGTVSRERLFIVE